MATRQESGERARNAAFVSQCAGDLRDSRERVRRAHEALRRALREAEEAEGAYHLATRRLDREPGMRWAPRGPGLSMPQGGSITRDVTREGG